MTIDRKFIIAAQNPVNGKKYSQEDCLILCAKDKAVPAALRAYHKECMEIGCGSDHTHSVWLLLKRVEEYQRNIESRIPDTVGEELPRCIDGEGV